jgi:hypothetical protein
MEAKHILHEISQNQDLMSQIVSFLDKNAIRSLYKTNRHFRSVILSIPLGFVMDKTSEKAVKRLLTSQETTPNIRSLVINDPDIGIPDYFPETLNKIRIFSVYLNMYQPCTLQFLNILSLDAISISIRANSLPSQLQSLNIHCHNFFSKLQDLPSSLQSLCIDVSGSIQPVLKNYPPTLKTLKIRCHRFNQCIDNLPPFLESLVIMSDCFNQPVNQLPSTLKSFMLQSIVFEHDLSQLPHGLETFVCILDICHLDLSALPVSLKHLCVKGTNALIKPEYPFHKESIYSELETVILTSEKIEHSTYTIGDFVMDVSKLKCVFITSPDTIIPPNVDTVFLSNKMLPHISDEAVKSITKDYVESTINEEMKLFRTTTSPAMYQKMFDYACTFMQQKSELKLKAEEILKKREVEQWKKHILNGRSISVQFTSDIVSSFISHMHLYDEFHART